MDRSTATVPQGAIVSVGADVDVALLDAEIRAEIARKERDGLYPPELLQEIAEDTVRDRMEALRAAAELTLDPPVHSTRPLLGPAVGLVKRTMGKALRWHTRWQVGQVQTLGGSAVAVLAAMEERLDELERRVHHMAEQVAQIQAAHLVSVRSPSTAAAGPGAAWDAAVRDAARLRELAARPAQSRVLCLGCGDGRFLEVLAASGASCHGVEPDRDLARRCRERGLDVREEAILEHLSAVPESSLGAIVVEAGDRLGPSALEDLFRWAASALMHDGVLVVEITADGGFEPSRAERPKGVPYGFLAESVGFRRVSVDEPPAGGSRLSPVLAPDQPAVEGMVSAINANLRLIDDALHGSQLVRVVARR